MPRLFDPDKLSAFWVTGLVRFGRPEVELAKSAGAQETPPNFPLVSAQMNKSVLALFGIFCRWFCQATLHTSELALFGIFRFFGAGLR